MSPESLPQIDLDERRMGWKLAELWGTVNFSIPKQGTTGITLRHSIS